MRGLGQIICGTPGIGKTTFALEFPKPVTCISMHETGYDSFEAQGEVPQGCQNVNLTDYEQLCTFIEKSTQKTLVLDGLRGFQQVYFAYLTKTHFEGSSSKFNAYYTGPRRIGVDNLPYFLSLLNIKLAKGTHLVLLSHSSTDKVTNATGKDYQRATIDMDDGIRDCFLAWSPNIYYMSLETDITSEKATVLSAPTRLMYTSLSLAHCAKNKIGLPQFISMKNSPKEAFDAYWKLVPPVYKG